jgi:hypothetical protein
MERILRSQDCFKIRFRLMNVGIDSYMWPYVADVIATGTWLNVSIGGGNGYDPKTQNVSFSDDNPSPSVIVHEATHILINATHVNKTIRTGVGEAAAYLAEYLFALYSGDEDNWSGQPHLERPLSQLANFVKDYTIKGKASVVCPPAWVNYIIAILKANAVGQDMDKELLQTGIGDPSKS